MKIAQSVPDGRTLLVGSLLRFVGPCQATATVQDGAAITIVDTPPPAAKPSAADIADVQARRELLRSDAAMARVTEDIVTVLVAKGVIALADMPADAVELLAERYALRDKLIPSGDVKPAVD